MRNSKDYVNVSKLLWRPQCMFSVCMLDHCICGAIFSDIW